MLPSRSVPASPIFVVGLVATIVVVVKSARSRSPAPPPDKTILQRGVARSRLDFFSLVTSVTLGSGTTLSSRAFTSALLLN